MAWIIRWNPAVFARVNLLKSLAGPAQVLTLRGGLTACSAGIDCFCGFFSGCFFRAAVFFEAVFLVGVLFAFLVAMRLPPLLKLTFASP